MAFPSQPSTARSTEVALAAGYLAERLRARHRAGEDALGSLKTLVGEALDLWSHRLDAWVTSVATRRLECLRQEQANRRTPGRLWLRRGPVAGQPTGERPRRHRPAGSHALGRLAARAVARPGDDRRRTPVRSAHPLRQRRPGRRPLVCARADRRRDRRGRPRGPAARRPDRLPDRAAAARRRRRVPDPQRGDPRAARGRGLPAGTAAPRAGRVDHRAVGRRRAAPARARSRRRGRAGRPVGAARQGRETAEGRSRGRAGGHRRRRRPPAGRVRVPARDRTRRPRRGDARRARRPRSPAGRSGGAGHPATRSRDHESRPHRACPEPPKPPSTGGRPTGPAPKPSRDSMPGRPRCSATRSASGSTSRRRPRARTSPRCR